MLYLSFTISGNVYAIPVKHIEESIQLAAITRIPQMPDYVLGVMNLRGKIVPVYDARIRMGLKSNVEERNELKDLLKQREQEHINWVTTLEEEVHQGKPITVQKDPCLCNFGKWYRPFLDELVEKQKQTGNVDNVFLGVLKKFENPHKEIHALAEKADTLVKSGKTDEAIAVIEQGKLKLERLQKLFKHFYQVIDEQSVRDIILIVNKNNMQFGITVDAINTTVEINELQELKEENEVVEALSVDKNYTIQILNLESFWEGLAIHKAS